MTTFLVIAAFAAVCYFIFKREGNASTADFKKTTDDRKSLNKE